MFALPRFPAVVMLACAATWVVWVPNLGQCQPPASDRPVDQVESEQAAPEHSQGESLTEEQRLQIEDWIEELGSNEFATRERAAAGLMEMGKEVLPQLNQALKETQDAETRLRAEQIIRQLTEGDLQARISEFISGKDVDFAGWNTVQSHLGDSVAVRELFVEMMLTHPGFVESLEGTARDRALAMEGLITRVQNRFRDFTDEPTKADLFALLILGNDPTVTTNVLFESLLLNLTNRHITTMVFRDPQLGAQFEGLLSKWIMRSSLTSREEVLLLGIRFNLPTTLPLALQTIDETTQTQLLATCMQALAKFGNRQHTETLQRFLSDERVASSRGFGEEQAQPQVRDLAMLTLALIYGVPLQEIGMSHVQTHPSIGFQIPDIAYESDPGKARSLAIERINQLLKEAETNKEES